MQEKRQLAASTTAPASVMIWRLSGAVNGGRLYGRWPGLKPKDLHAGDLPVTTDYRQVLQEILVKRCGQKTPKAVFSDQWRTSRSVWSKPRALSGEVGTGSPPRMRPNQDAFTELR